MQNTFLLISQSANDFLKYDVSEKINHYRTSIELPPIGGEDLMVMQKCFRGLDAHKISSTKISTFTVIMKYTVSPINIYKVRKGF